MPRSFFNYYFNFGIMYVCDAWWWSYPNYPLTASLLAFIPSSHPPFLSSVCLSFSGTMHAVTIMIAMVRLQIKGEPINPPPSFNFHPPFTPLLWCSLRLQEGGHRCPIWDQALNNQSFATLCPVTSPHVGHMHASYFNIWSIANSFWCKIWGVFKVCFCG